jgi:hypothetical protein
MKVKKCCRCKEEKDISLFGKNAFHKTDGIHHYCKECSNKIATEWRKEHHEDTLLAVKKYREKEENRFKMWSSQTISDHKIRKNNVSIDKKELTRKAEITTNCRYCDTELDYTRGNKFGSKFNSPSLDRIDNDINMNINNTQIICHKCNTIKQNMTHNEFIEYCNKISIKFGDKNER